MSDEFHHAPGDDSGSTPDDFGRTVSDDAGTGATRADHARTQPLPTFQKSRFSVPTLRRPCPRTRRRTTPAGRGVSGRPAGILALVVLVASGFLLYDVVSVRTGRPAMEWRRWLADRLSTVSLDTIWVLVIAAVIAVIGLWLIVLALTPGLRRLLPMRRPSADIRPGLDRSAAALVLRDRAMKISGVQSVKVSVGRHKARTRAVSHFRDLDEVSGELHTALDDALRQLALARRPALSVRVKRPSKR
ncbi:DUF6286 domain-containing protein [Streptomyces sp. NPDC057543]|uniref:DUF6286 domain-containing protein n=1 Tax=Streptomyces sp. NPDC057543 TaxID=3346163 RepID=UPI003698FB29